MLTQEQKTAPGRRVNERVFSQSKDLEKFVGEALDESQRKLREKGYPPK